MDTKQIITNFLNDQKSFKDFFSCIGEYIDGRFSSCKAVHDLEDWLVEKVNEKTPMIDKVEALKVLELSEIRQTLLGIEIELSELRQDYLMNIEFKNE